MARQRCALPLIIVSTLVLGTVITAFRLRDAPKSSEEVSARRNPLIEKCVDCDIERDEKSIQKVQTPNRLSYEDVKKAVKEKQQSLNEKKHQQHQKVPQFTIDDDEDDSNDDDAEFSKIRSSKDINGAGQHKKDKGKISHIGVQKSILPPALKVNPRAIKHIAEESGSDNDNDQDDDDDDDSDEDDADSADDEGDEDDDGDDADSDDDEGDDDDDDEDDEDDDDDYEDEDTGDDSEDDTISKTIKERDVKFTAKPQSSVKINTFKKVEDNRKKTAVNKRELVDDSDESDDNDEDNDDDFDEDDDSDNDSEDDKKNKILKATSITISKSSVVKQQQLKQQSSVTVITPKKSEDTKKGQIKMQENNDDRDDGDNEDDDDDDDEDSDSDNYEDNKEFLKKKSKSESPNIVMDISKAQKSESPIASKMTPTQRVPEKSKKLSPVKESVTTESKSTVIPTTKQKKEQPIEKDKKDITKDEAKKDHTPHQELKQDSKQPHDKDPKVLHQDSKKGHKEPEIKAIKDLNKQKPKEEKKKDVVGKEVKKIDPKSEHTKTKELVGKDVKKIDTKSEHTKTKDDQNQPEKKHSEFKLEKEKEVLRHASDALFRKNNFLQSEFEDFYAFMPSFSPNFSRIHNAECRRQGQILMRQLRGTKLWALNMLDATGKVPSGILQGNGNQLGDFDQCLESKARVRLDSGHVVKIHGKYCLAQIDLRSDDPVLRFPIHLAQARNLVKSKIDDPGHFIPRFSSLNWGVCLPASCGPDEAEFVLRDSLRHYHLAGLNVRVNVDPLNCHTATDDSWEEWMEPETLITLSLFSVVLLIVLYATLKDYFARRSSSTDESESSKEESEDALKCDEDNAEKETENEDTNRKSTDEGIVASFSLYSSCSRLLRDGDAEDIACIHGVRAICSLALLLAHKIIPVANTPFSNRGQLTELSHTPLSLPLRTGWLYTDAFLLLSGALTAHRLSADMDGDAGMPWLRRYIARYVRLTPALLFTVLFYAYVWDKLGAGPLWGTLVSCNAGLCQGSWWWNILYVQNYFPFDVMCAPQTYQLALDMQLTLTAAALVWAVRSRPLPAAGVLLALQALTAYARYSTTSEHRLSLLIYHGASVSQLYRTARLTYTSTLHRSTPYVFGVVLGVLLQNLPTIHLSMLVTIPCWLLCIALSAGTTYASLDAASPDTRYSASAAASYAALAPAAAAAALAWFIYAAHSGNAQRINRMLCAKPLVIISRLSYAMYLCQFVVFFSNAATVKTSTQFTIFSIIDIQELITILAASTVMTLTLVIPMQSFSKYIMSYKFESTEETTEELQQENDPEETGNTEEVVEDQPPEPEEEIEEVTENYNGHRIMAHRELLEEIIEAEIEYESQRDGRDEGLEEILEEEEDELGEEEMIIEEDGGEEDMEVVDRSEVEGDGGGEDFWSQQEEVYVPRSRPRTFNSRGSGEWEWSGGGQGSSSPYR